MELTDNLRKEILKLLEDVEIQNTVFLTKRASLKVSQEVRNYYDNTNKSVKKIKELLQ